MRGGCAEQGAQAFADFLDLNVVTGAARGWTDRLRGVE